MEYILIILLTILLIVLLGIIIGFNPKKIKQIAENKRLDEITSKFPDNIDICKSILKKLNNNNIKIEENKESKSSLYIVFSNKISIANIRDSYTRIQTIAHECIHSIQNKNMLWANFIYSNLYIVYFWLIAILTVFKVVKPSMLQVALLILFGALHYFIRAFLETDAMTRARYIAKEYLEENDICSKEQINEIVEEYDKLNDAGIKLVNFNLFAKNCIKVVIYCIICLFVV